MLLTRFRLLIVVVVTILVFSVGQRGSTARVGVRHSLPLRAAAQIQAPSELIVRGTIYFHLNNRSELNQLLGEQQDIRSSNYHRWLTPAEFAARFGAQPADYQAALDWLHEQGISDTHRWTNRLSIEFQAPVREIERVFNVRMKLYQLDDEIFYATADDAQLPTRLAENISDLKLHNFIQTRPMYRVVSNIGQSAIEPKFNAGGRIAIGPQDMQLAYNFNPLLAAGIDGHGEKIGIVARTDFNLEDVETYRTTFNLPPAHITKIPAGGEIIDRGGGEQTEILIDTEIAGAAAPRAELQVVIADKDSDIDQSFAYLVNNLPDTKVISISFNLCERDLLPTFENFFNNLSKQAAAQGQTVLVASGDGGSNDCGDGSGLQVGGLAASPFVTGVGGTSLNVAVDSAGNVTDYRGEAAWKGSGGGLSLLYARPAYQNIAAIKTDARALPDVSLLADPSGPGFLIVQDGFGRVIGGTSASTPAWAGIFALANQFAAANSVGLKGFGLANPRIYQLGLQQQQGGVAIFNDIVTGDNGSAGVTGYPAQTGYDFSTGWGSPNVDRFVRNFIQLPDMGSGLFLLAPNGGEILSKDQPISIRWQLADALAAETLNQDLMISTDSGNSYKTVIKGLAATARSYELDAAGLITASARLRVVVHTGAGAMVIDSSDSDLNIGTDLRIEFARYSTIDSRIEMIGSGFSNMARLIVNGKRLNRKAVMPDKDTLIFSGSTKKLKLNPGENQIILEVDGVRSSVYRLILS